MSNIKDYVCTVEQSKRLRELDVRRDSIFVYTSSHGYLITRVHLEEIKRVLPPRFFNDIAPAYTLQELYEILNTIDYPESICNYLENDFLCEIILDPKSLAKFIINYIECEKELAEGECEDEKGSSETEVVGV